MKSILRRFKAYTGVLFVFGIKLQVIQLNTLRLKIWRSFFWKISKLKQLEVIWD